MQWPSVMRHADVTVRHSASQCVTKFDTACAEIRGVCHNAQHTIKSAPGTFRSNFPFKISQKQNKGMRIESYDVGDIPKKHSLRQIFHQEIQQGGFCSSKLFINVASM